MRMVRHAHRKQITAFNISPLSRLASRYKCLSLYVCGKDFSRSTSIAVATGQDCEASARASDVTAAVRRGRACPMVSLRVDRRNGPVQTRSVRREPVEIVVSRIDVLVTAVACDGSAAAVPAVAELVAVLREAVLRDEPAVVGHQEAGEDVEGAVGAGELCLGCQCWCNEYDRRGWLTSWS